MSSEPGNESFLCALRPILRILSLQGQITRIKFKLCSCRDTADRSTASVAGCRGDNRACLKVTEWTYIPFEGAGDWPTTHIVAAMASHIPSPIPDFDA
jgi:hypothetical protein